MRTLLKAARLVAENGLYLPQSSSGGGGSGPLPATTFTVMVNKGGNDATGDGTDEKPFLTATKGIAVAGALAVAPDQQALVLLGPGLYSENVEIPPFVFVSAQESGQTVILGTGIGSSVTLSPAWAAEPPGTLPIGGVEQIAIVGLVDINFTGVQTAGPIFIIGGGQTTIGGGITVVGDSVNGGQLDTLPGTLIGGPTNVTGASLFSLGSGFSNVINVTSTAAQPASWTSSGDILLNIVVTIDATAGMNVVASLDGTGFIGSLTLHDGGGGVTSFSATSGGIPSTVTLLGGAAPPVPISPIIGLNSKLATGANAAATLVATSNGTGGVTWSDLPGGPVFTGAVTTVGAVVSNIGPAIPIPASTLANVKYAVLGFTTAGVNVDDCQAVVTYAAFKNVPPGVVTLLNTHAVGVVELQYDASMNPGVAGVVTTPISGTNLQFQVTGVAGQTIDWKITIEIQKVS